MRRHRGFTLVELLVVIAIIGVLVGLLVPAVNIAREIARRNQCLSNLRSLGQAMVSHATEKGYFPGRTNVIRTTSGTDVQVSWMTKILPYTEQGTVWDAVLLDPNPDYLKPSYAINLPLATCPSDPPQTDAVGRLSYVANTGSWDMSWPKYEDMQRYERANGVCHALESPSSNLRVDPGYVSKNDGASTTLLATENVNALLWFMLDEGAHGIVWTLQPWVAPPQRPGDGAQYKINEGQTLQTDFELIQSDPAKLFPFARPSSFHSGGVNAVFCDSHAKFLSDEIDPDVYARLLTPSGVQSRHPDSNNFNQPAPFQVIPLSTDDLK